MISLTFPGENTIKISQAALKNMLQEAFQAQFGAALRITGVDFPSSYSSSPLTVDFTTDDPNPPLVAPVPVAPSAGEDPL